MAGCSRVLVRSRETEMKKFNKIDDVMIFDLQTIIYNKLSDFLANQNAIQLIY